MGDDSIIALIVLIALAVPVAAIAGFFMALGLRGRTSALEARLAALELKLAEAGIMVPVVSGDAFSGTEQPAPAPEEKAQVAPRPEPATEPEGPLVPEEPAEEPAPHLAPAAAATAAPQAGLEERLGSRWAVWVGGVALALGGVLLVRYSIEEGYFGPAARIFAGLATALTLIAGGEWLRRREHAGEASTLSTGGVVTAHVPSVLTAAGTMTAFASVYAAHALYGFIGPAFAFALLGLIGVATMVAAALHGPALAALGLLGALAAPLLVTSDDPQPWPVVIYLVAVVAAAYGLARLRLWRWLAYSAAGGALLWGWLVVSTVGNADALPAMVLVLAQTVLAVVFLVALPHGGALPLPADVAAAETEGEPPAETGEDGGDAEGAAPAEPKADPPFWTWPLDIPALAVLSAFGALAILAGDLAGGGGRATFSGAMVAILLATGFTYAAAAGAGLIAALVAAGCLAFWPVARLAMLDPGGASLPGGPALAPGEQPAALSLYLAFAIAAGAALLAAAVRRLMRGEDLPLVAAACHAAAGTTGVLALLVIAYWRVTAFDTSVPFALAAAVLALLFTGAARLLHGDGGEARPVAALGTGAMAAAALAALALGLTFALEKGMLTVAFALSTLGTAFVSQRIAVPVLRYAVGATGLLVLGRVVWDPAIAGDALGTTPIFNWLLWGYGVPALAFALAARVLAMSGRDRVTQLCESLAILFCALLVFFEIRHALHGGDPFAPDSGFVEMGLMATAGLAFSIVLMRLELHRADPVYHFAGLAFGVLTLIVAGFGLLLAENPLFTDEPVLGGAVFNTLVLAYLVPAVIAAGLAWLARAHRPTWYVRSALALALLLHLAFTINIIRFLFQGPQIGLWRQMGEAELWTYSAALVVIGVAILAVGLWRNWRFARLASAPYILIAVVKVFVVDLSSLEGVLRALSFIGLGLVLVGIGLAYQKLLRRGGAGIPVADDTLS
ncbi:DUF2339 domain-containing protein [Chelatococcus sp. XZ-Ab1]|uniref:DUF2339 domain-containing protein n=1 Tax=Chelatococcus sp. XZ-Ab1 TaxID=3034027 RepID=UPI0023E41993|nr:DUF2339 domain-containing protein [Chelatococcus sp. XZ-Ab1]